MRHRFIRYFQQNLRFLSSINDIPAMAQAPLPKRQAGDAGLNMEKPGAEVVQHAFQLCKEYLGGGWSHMKKNDFDLTPLGGGLTNKLYICTLLSNRQNNSIHVPNTVLLRLYGLILQDFPAQIQESVVFSILAERGIGPRLYGVFSGGRLEEYVESRTLKTNDLNIPWLSKQIAIRLSEYHRLVMPVQKDPTCIMLKLFSYLEKIKDADFKMKYKQQLYEKFSLYDVTSEADYLQKMISDLNPAVVFCHNDAQEGNILCHTNGDNKGNPVQLIDYEYSCYNYRGFDFANHFCEWMYNYSHRSWPFFTYKKEDFPDRTQQVRFVEAYLDSMYEAVPSRKDDDMWSVERVLYESDRFVLMSHLFWALWSVRQAMISDIKFGYLEYALVRMENYFQHKKLLEQ